MTMPQPFEPDKQQGLRVELDQIVSRDRPVTNQDQKLETDEEGLHPLLTQLDGLEHKNELDREALILELKTQVAAADFELEVLELLKNNLQKSDFQRQTLFRRLSRAIDISDPEHGLLPDHRFDDPKNPYNLNQNLLAIYKLYALVGLPLITNKLLGSYIPGNFLFDAAASYIALYSFLNLSQRESRIVKTIGEVGWFILGSPLIIPAVVTQGVKSILGTFTSAFNRQSEVEKEAESKLDKMLSPIRAQKLTLEQRSDARNDLRDAVDERINDITVDISPLREQLEKLLRDAALDKQVQDRLREIEEHRIEEERLSSVIDEAIGVLDTGSSISQKLSSGEEVKANRHHTPLFSDLAKFSKEELEEVYSALDDDNSFFALQNSESNLVRNLVSGIVQSFNGEELKIAKKHLKEALLLHIEVHS